MVFISSKISELGRDIWHTYLSISRFNSIFDKFPVLDELLSSPLVSELKRKRHSKKSSAKPVSSNAPNASVSLPPPVSTNCTVETGGANSYAAIVRQTQLP